ncbi:matrix metalloproteinase-23 isoform X1 [Camelus dromedarius]|uniref:matrix metalloproteinase-23 isoform X1 n=1 Tax=Camelus dromedarius TaxID=9838 RepID=UPI00311A4E06
MGRGACVPSEASGTGDRPRRLGAVLGALCLLPALVLLTRPGVPAARPAASAAQGDAAPHPAGVPAPASLGPLHPQAPRRRRYTLTPARLRWDHFNLTYRILSFPRNLLSPSETRRGLAAAFRMWSDVSPFSFREVAPEQPSDLRIGFYPVNHTDCLVSPLHHCFDGPTGELAHAFFPPHGGIHFDDSEYWVLGPTRYSWKKGDGRPGLLWGPSHHDGHGGGSWGSWLQWGSSMQGGEGCEEAWRPGFLEPEAPPPPHRRSWSCIPGGQLTASLAWNILIFPWLRRGRLPALPQMCGPRGVRPAGGGRRAGPGSEALTGRACRRVAHRPGARGGPRDRPRAGPDALSARPGAHAPQRHAARLEGSVTGRAVGAAPALRLPGPAVRVRVLGAEGLLRRPPAAHEEAVPQQL